MNLTDLSTLYASIGLPIVRKNIEDSNLQVFSQNVRKLWFGLGEWRELSQGLEQAIGVLRRSDWRLRNDPSPRTPTNVGIQQMRSGVELLSRYQLQLPEDLRHFSELLTDSAWGIEQVEIPELTKSIIESTSVFVLETGLRVSLVLTQANIKGSVDDWIRDMAIQNIDTYLTSELSGSSRRHERILLVGLTKDYPDWIFTTIFPAFGIQIFSPSWINDQVLVRGLFPDLSMTDFDVPIIAFAEPAAPSNQTVENFESYLEPSGEIEARRLETYARRAFSYMKEEGFEELVGCKAYLLANSQVVFFPLDSSEINTLDLSAAPGDRVHRVPISTITAGKVVLLRLGTSDTDSIISMANALGGKGARVAREAQQVWKSSLTDKIQKIGSAKVSRELKELGIKSPWIQEWCKASNIRPNSDEVFTILLRYLDLPIEETIEQMNHLRYLHQVAGMRLRKLLEKQFESMDFSLLSEEGELIVEIEEASGVAKLGAFVIFSVGTEVFNIPHGSVRQIQTPQKLESQWLE